MAREWWQRLPAQERREYERSASLSKIALPADERFPRIVDALARALAAEDRDGTERTAQALVDRICLGLRIPTVRLQVEGRRPPDGEGELHGIYRPGEGDELDHISVWMRTAKRHEVVAVRTFLRTLLHEVVHHVDMRHLDLPNSFHNKGFYQRESSLFRVVTRGSSLARSARRGAPPPAPAETDVQRGLELLRNARETIASRRRTPQD